MGDGYYNMRKETWRISFFGVMLAIITVLSYVESTMPPFPFMPPNIRLGLSNIVTMYCLFFIGKKSAFTLTVLKSAFVLLTRGPVAGILSLTGGSFSLLVIVMLMSILKKEHVSYLMLSVFGAIAHNLGQIFAASILLQYNIVIYYFPVSIIAGCVMGTVTGSLLRVSLPLFDRIDAYGSKKK